LEEALFNPRAACLNYLDQRLLRTAWNEFLAGAWDGARLFYALWLYEVCHARKSSCVVS
jgi:hypothetical protein